MSDIGKLTSQVLVVPVQAQFGQVNFESVPMQTKSRPLGFEAVYRIRIQGNWSSYEPSTGAERLTKPRTSIPPIVLIERKNKRT